MPRRHLGGTLRNPSFNIFCTFAFEGAEMSLSTAVTISKTVTRAERDECVAFPSHATVFWRLSSMMRSP